MSDAELTAQDIERKDFPPEYLLDRVEELAVKVYALTNENEDLTRQLKTWNSLDNVRELRSQLAAVTAERDALKAELDAVPVKAISYYFDNSVAIDSAPLYDYAMAEHAVKAWLETTRR